MQEDVDADKFTKAISENPCCATCRFFVSSNIIRRIDKGGSRNRIWAFSVEGQCQRFPMQVISPVIDGSDVVWGSPPVIVIAEEFAQEDGSFFTVSDKDGHIEGSRPWCGEYVDQHHGFESDEFLNGIDYSDL